MATQGNYAAYRELTNTPDTISADIQYWNEDAARRRQERQALDNEMYDREQKARADKKNMYNKYIKPQNAWETGSSSLNEVVSRAISNATEQFIPTIETLETEPPGSEKYIKAQMKLANLGNFADNMKLFTDKLTERNAFIMSEVEKGNIDDDDVLKAYKKSFQNGWDTFQVGIDDNGIPVIAYADKDGDGENDYTNVETFDNIKNGISEFKFNKKYNSEAMAKVVASELGQHTSSIEEGYKTNKTIGFNPEALDQRARALVVTPTGQLTPEGEYFMEKELGLEDSGENRLKTIEYMRDKIKAYDKTTREVTIDHSARTAAAKEQRLREKENPKIKVSEPVRPSDDIWSLADRNIDPDKVMSVNVENVELPTVTGSDGVIYSDVSVHNVTFDEDGNMVIDGSSVIEAGGIIDERDGTRKLPDKKKRGSVTLTDEEASSVAYQMDTTLEELKNRLIKGAPVKEVPGISEKSSVL